MTINKTFINFTCIDGICEIRKFSANLLLVSSLKILVSGYQLKIKLNLYMQDEIRSDLDPFCYVLTWEAVDVEDLISYSP